MPAMLIDSSDFYHFRPLSLALIVAEAHKVHGKQTWWTHILAQLSADKDNIWYGIVTVQLILIPL